MGYSLQQTLFVSLLLQSRKESIVSLEVFEDIGVETPGEGKLAVQSKSTSNGNPVSDRSIDFWKTFHNWLTAVEKGELDPDNTLFKIYVSKKVTGPIAESFSNAKTIAQAKEALISAQTELWGKAPAFEKRSSVALGISAFVEHIFNDDKDLISKIICSFELETGSGSPQSDLRDIFSKLLCPDEIIEDLNKYALGWVKDKIDRAIENNEAAIIKVSEFRTTLVSFIGKRSSKSILSSFARDPDPTEINAERLKKYVRQLEFIESPDDQKIRAIIDFLKASSARTEWSEKGLVFEESFNEFEDNLIRTWKNLRTKTFLNQNNASPSAKGQILYSECSLHRAHLQAMETPSHFIPGSYNALADIEKVGWHPDYLQLLKNDMIDPSENDTSTK
ncbi:MAG: hypothetical protein A2509_03625 [Candidatus Edwardsbacteria bacterium RIFOXYD12_FULL_50_11]|uniref:ABC-three component systems C-terminal domain-containing protein n=1 Tax=Candidatus Edwardsbacteria bacterium GWF2_54_11 TaxID=1817851 RepID=A0A1F5R7S0_9BACT|nr:MAG: hypothetical protein A2502_03540 [Candidatus Edwardsbacteria bacterium RifOxyC12_full_54_24]OGF07786.1 MAG: hypothetical protein A2273_04790 [Candidatus Edwardsbacteria bacterium RifOxyA12_full_54_48]OGF10034.1 MAG: hypothetical protein A3K15_11200 [Candidatus Edwardsbacteria bacterium GWE2_54_12]OGF10497.1 MAG: hypothetical protein A2024_09110 [Candidatus Edwardsbacteria bacterium GWF2_54_11]OGF14946.1 MAG: hypothetical protein A2509_03625 [Candidatus Edwardsbacteria bacterium RIFOXYD1